MNIFLKIFGGMRLMVLIFEAIIQSIPVAAIAFVIGWVPFGIIGYLLGIPGLGIFAGLGLGGIAGFLNCLSEVERNI